MKPPTFTVTIAYRGEYSFAWEVTVDGPDGSRKRHRFQTRFFARRWAKRRIKRWPERETTTYDIAR